MKSHRRVLLLWLCLLSVWNSSVSSQESKPTIQMGHKPFAESQIIAEMGKHLLIDVGMNVEIKQFGSSKLVWEALLTGEIDIYPDYTGTLRFENLQLDKSSNLSKVLESLGLKMSKSLGFENSYALGMSEAKAKELGIQSISDLKRHQNLRFGFGREFVNRIDGWNALTKHYSLPHKNVTVYEHSLLYGAVESGEIDVIEVYTTESNIERFNIRLLKDDKKNNEGLPDPFFPGYEAIWVYRPKKIPPKAMEALFQLEGRISEKQMRRHNGRVTRREQSAPQSAVELLREEFPQKDIKVIEDSLFTKMLRWTLQHLKLVSISLTLGVLFAIPLGILATKNRFLELIVLGTVGILQTIPSLALLMFFVPLFKQGFIAALVALFLYSLLPIVRNTHAGLKEIPNSLKESAAALGLPAWARLWYVELPLASRSILAGIKTSAVINVGFAALGGFIGAGGFGDPILQGLSRIDMTLILQGAGGAAVLALLVQGLFELIERFLSPKGLRIQSQSS